VPAGLSEAATSSSSCPEQLCSHASHCTRSQTPSRPSPLGRPRLAAWACAGCRRGSYATARSTATTPPAAAARGTPLSAPQARCGPPSHRAPDSSRHLICSTRSSHPLRHQAVTKAHRSAAALCIPAGACAHAMPPSLSPGTKALLHQGRGSPGARTGRRAEEALQLGRVGRGMRLQRGHAQQQLRTHGLVPHHVVPACHARDQSRSARMWGTRAAPCNTWAASNPACTRGGRDVMGGRTAGNA